MQRDSPASAGPQEAEQQPAGTAAGRLPDVVKPGFHGARTHWIRGFMAFQLARRIQVVMLMVPM
jgi:hypothetical protein